MATTVDIIVRAKDSQLDRLQRKMERLGKVTKSADNAINALDKELTKLGTNAGMEEAIRDIDIYRGKLAQARQAAKALARENLAPRVSGGSGGSGGGGGGDDGGGFSALGGFALLDKRFSNQFPTSGEKFEKSVENVKNELRESVQFSESLSDSMDNVEIVKGKIADQMKRQSIRAKEIDTAQRALNAATGQQKRLQNAIEKGQAKQTEAVAKTKTEVAQLRKDMTGYRNTVKSSTKEANAAQRALNAATKKQKGLQDGIASGRIKEEEAIKAAQADITQLSADMVKYQNTIKDANKKGNAAQEALNTATERQKRLQADVVIGQLRQEEAAKKAKIEIAQLGANMTGYKNDIKSANAAITQHKKAVEGLAPEYAEAKAEVLGIEQSLDRQARTIATNRAKGGRKGALIQSAGAGLAFADVPGQDIFQAGAAGSLIGGPKGAAVAAAVTGVVKLTNAMVKYANEAAVAAAEMAKFEIALRSVSGAGFVTSLGIIDKAVNDFNIPLIDATQNFTQLLAAANSAGFELGETEKVFRAVSAANKALGGDSEKLKGILLATTQVFSKGRVSAEELRGQIGERLAGAFADFATASGISTAQLDKNLERGEVSLEQFVKFAEFLLEKYEEDAKKIADSPAEAGARLEQSLQKLSINVGTLLAPIGAAFQEEFTAIVDIINDAIKALNKFLGLGTDGAISKVERELAAARDRLQYYTNIERRNVRNGMPWDDTYIKSAIDDIDRLQTKLRELKGVGDPASGRVPDTGEEEEKDTAAEKRAKRLAEELEKRLRIAKQVTITEKEIFELEVQRAKAAASGNEVLARRIEGIQEEVKLRIDLFRALENETDERIKQELTAQNLLKVENARLRTAEDLLGIIRKYRREAQDEFTDFFQGDQDLMSQLDDAQSEFNEFFKNAMDKMGPMEELLTRSVERVGDAIANSIGAAIDAAITGADSLNESLQQIAASLLQDLGMMFIKAGIGGLGTPGTAGSGSGLLGQIFNRESGGPVSAKQPYIVGEAGQELFIPNVSGTIVPNDIFEATKAALIEDGEIITTDDSEAETASALSANNSSISADAETAKALERNSEVINSTLRSSEVQSALTENNKSIKNINYGDSTSVSEAFAVNNNSIQSQRLAAATTTERETMHQLMNSSSKMTVSYESTVINQQEYVTAEQHQKGVTQAAMKGRDMALASLKNSVRARKGIGLS